MPSGASAVGFREEAALVGGIGAPPVAGHTLHPSLIAPATNPTYVDPQALRALIDEEMVILPIAGLCSITAQSSRIEGYQPHAALVHTDLCSIAKR